MIETAIFSLDIRPIHNLKADGNSIVDVVIYKEDLWVRVINYKRDKNSEKLISKDCRINEFDFGRQISGLVVKAQKYCIQMSKILSTSDLSHQAVEIIDLLKSNNWLSISAIQRETGQSKQVILSSIDQLSDKFLISRVGFEKYSFDDRYKHMRDLFCNKSR